MKDRDLSTMPSEDPNWFSDVGTWTGPRQRYKKRTDAEKGREKADKESQDTMRETEWSRRGCAKAE